MGRLFLSKYLMMVLGGCLLASSSMAIAAVENAPNGSSSTPGMMMGAGCHGREFKHGPGMMGYGAPMMMGRGCHGREYSYVPGMMHGMGYGSYRMRGNAGDYRQGMMGAMGYGAGMMGLDMMSGRGYGMGMFSGFGRRFDNRKLNLTDKQRQQLFEIREKSARHFWSLFGQMQEYRIALARSLMSLEPDQEMVDRAFSNLSQTRKKLLNLHLANRKAALKILTPKQRKLLQVHPSD